MRQTTAPPPSGDGTYGSAIIGNCQNMNDASCVAIKEGSGTFDIGAGKGRTTVAIEKASGVYKIGGLLII